MTRLILALLAALISTTAAATEIACTVRNSGGKWSIISDAAHHPIGCAAVSANATGVFVTFTARANWINSCVVGPDEFWAVRGITVGASVGLDKMALEFGQGGKRLSPSALNASLGNFWIRCLVNQ